MQIRTETLKWYGLHQYIFEYKGSNQILHIESDNDDYSPFAFEKIEINKLENGNWYYFKPTIYPSIQYGVSYVFEKLDPEIIEQFKVVDGIDLIVWFNSEYQPEPIVETTMEPIQNEEE